MAGKRTSKTETQATRTKLGGLFVKLLSLGVLESFPSTGVGGRRFIDRSTVSASAPRGYVGAEEFEVS
jgi:hypothetical protein